MEDAPRKDAPSDDQAPQTNTTIGIYIKPSSFSLEKWVGDVRSAAPEDAESALNRSAFTVGLQIPRKRVDETVATKELIKAGIDAGLAASIAESVVKRALRDAMAIEKKRIDKRQPTSNKGSDAAPQDPKEGGAS